MGKKKKNRGDLSERGGRKGNRSWEFLNVTFENVDLQTIKRHILYLIAISILTKLVVLFMTPVIFHSFIDLFDIGTYFQSGLNLANGQIPYINFQPDYPILFFIPVILALIPAFFTTNVFAFVFTFQILMVCCDIVILLSIYFIGIKIFNETTAFYASLLYATAFSTAYFIVTKYDAFPASLFMLAILFMVYGKNTKGYILASAGFFAKIYPILLFPFMVLYNAKKSSIKQELFASVKILAIFTLVLLVPFVYFKNFRGFCSWSL